MEWHSSKSSLSWVPAARDENTELTEPLYPSSQCTHPSSALQLLCTHPLLQWWVVWGFLVPCWILSLSPGGCGCFYLGCSFCCESVHTGLRASLGVTEQEFRISSAFLGGNLQLVAEDSTTSATHAKENYSDRRMQFKRIQQTELIYHSPAIPDKEGGCWFYFICSSTNKRITFFTHFQQKAAWENKWCSYAEQKWWD